MNNIHKLNGFIYVTSEEKPSIGDWSINLNCKYAHQELCTIDNEIELNSYVNSYENDCKKVILTNDSNLTNVQQLTPEEEAYCKTVDSVEVEFSHKNKHGFFEKKASYKLQLPKLSTKLHIGEIVDESYPEEFRKKETIDEFAKRRFNEQKLDTYTMYNIENAIKEGYNEAVKTLYTADDMLGFAEYLRNEFIPSGENWKQGTFEYEETELLEMYDRHFKEK